MPEWIKDENEFNVNTTWLRHHPSSAPSMLNESKSCLYDTSLHISDNNIMLQHNKERIAVANDEDDDE